MSHETSHNRQSRYNLMLKDNVEKIINNGIKFNLKKLHSSSNVIEKYKNGTHKDKITREYMNARLIIQQLRANLNELEKCYNALENAEHDEKYHEMVQSIKSQVITQIDNFVKTNIEIEQKLNQIYEEPEENRAIEREQLSQQVHDSVNLAKSKQKLKEVELLNQDLEELHLLVTNFAAITQDQQVTVDRIENNVTEAATNVSIGTKSLIKASSYSMMPLTCAAIGGAIFGPLGGLIGFKLSTAALSGLGASALTYSFASYVKRKNKQISEIELQSLNHESENQ